MSLTLLPLERTFMANEQEDATVWGEWMIRWMRAKNDMTQKQLAALSGHGQSSISSYISGTRRPKSREIVMKIAQILMPEDYDASQAHDFINDALTAADYAPEEYQEHEVIEFLRGKPDPLKDKALKMFKAAFGEEDERENKGNIGKRSE